MRVEIDGRVAGIPCVIKGTYTKVKGSYSYNAPSDMDYYGYEEIEYELLDRKGYPAPWLERKANPEEVHEQIRSYCDATY